VVENIERKRNIFLSMSGNSGWKQRMSDRFGRGNSSMHCEKIDARMAKDKSRQGQGCFRKCRNPHSACHAMPTFLNVSPPLISLHHDDSRTPHFGKLHKNNTRRWKGETKVCLSCIHSQLLSRSREKKEYVQERNRRPPCHALGSPPNIIAPIVLVISGFQRPCL
jgi:hypothetical protein